MHADEDGLFVEDGFAVGAQGSHAAEAKCYVRLRIDHGTVGDHVKHARL